MGVEASEAAEVAEKVVRVKTWPKLSKPSGATHPVWKHYKIYQSSAMTGTAMCQLCFESGAFSLAEVKYPGGSPTKLMNHLNTQKPGHKTAYTVPYRQSASGVITNTVQLVRSAAMLKDDRVMQVKIFLTVF